MSIDVYFCVFSEINRVRLCLFHNKGSAREPLSLPDKAGPIVTLSEKLYVPVKEHPEVSKHIGLDRQKFSA